MPLSTNYTYEDFDVACQQFRANPEIFDADNHISCELTADRLARGVPVRRILAVPSEVFKGESKKLEGWISYVRPTRSDYDQDVKGVYYADTNIGELFCMTLTTDSRQWLLENVPSLFVDKNARQIADILDKFSGKALFDAKQKHQFVKNTGDDKKHRVTAVIGGASVFNTKLSNYVEIIDINNMDQNVVQRHLAVLLKQKESANTSMKLLGYVVTLAGVLYYGGIHLIDEKIRRDKEKQLEKALKKSQPHPND